MIDFCKCGKVKLSRDELCPKCEEDAEPKPVKVKEVETKGLF